MKWFFVALAFFACAKPPSPVARDFSDDFERPALGKNWLDTIGGAYRIVEGRVQVSHAYNHPLWLKQRLPRNAEIRFDAQSKSASGDIKVELWGDGKSHATQKGAYVATGYVLIHGGWNNRLTVLARMDEHGDNRSARRDMPVELGRVYHWRIARSGSQLSWWIDDAEVFTFDDPQPLVGAGHEYLGLNNWESSVSFDNVRIRSHP